MAKGLNRVWVAAALLAAVAASSACTALGKGAFSSDVDTVQLVSAKVGGKNVFIPSTVVVTPKARTLSIYNTTDIPHGFAIAGLGVEEIVQPGVEHRIDLPELQGGQVLRIHCQLHPPHRSATLVVLPGS